MKPGVKEWLLPYLEGRELLLVTFTLRGAIAMAAFSKAISHVIRCVKRRVLGRSGEDRDLAAVWVFEPSYKQGLHAHAIIEDPYSLGPEKAFACRVPIDQLIKEEWAALAIGGEPIAQDVQRVYDLDGALTYLLKNVGTSNFDGLDINNFCLPSPGGRTNLSNSHVPAKRDKP